MIKQIPELELEATDSLYGLEDNEGECIVKINDVLKPLISSKSQMQYTAETVFDISWQNNKHRSPERLR